MREVTCQLMKAFLEQFPAKGIPMEKAIVGTNLPLEFLLNTKERIDWDKACIIMRNGCALLGGPEKAADDWSRQFGKHEDLRYISRVAGLLASPYLVFRLGAEWFSPLTVRNIQFKLERLSVHRLRLTVRIPDTDQDSPEYFWLTYGALPGTTTFIGLPPSKVTMQMSERCGIYEIEMPRSRTISARVMALTRLVPGLLDLTGELRDQVEELSENAGKLERETRNFQAVLDSIGDGVLVLASGQVVYANPALAKILRAPAGTNMAAPGARKWLDVIGPAVLQEWPEDNGTMSRELQVRLSGESTPIFLEVSAPQTISWQNNSARLCFIRDATERRQLDQALAEIRERERCSIARDLHDGLGQQLTGLAFRLRALSVSLTEKESPVAPLATEVAGLAQRAISQARDMAHGLAPVEIDPRGLVPALRHLAATTSELFSVNCTFLLSGEPPSFPPAVANQLYRVAQEAVTNAVRHGRAKTIDVSLSTGGGTLVIAVTDNGGGLPEGFDSTKAAGMGVRIMRHRMDLVGGTISLKNSADGPGTKVELKVPLALAEFAVNAGNEAARRPVSSPKRSTLSTPGVCRVLLVDDHPIVRVGIRELLRQTKDYEVCGEAGSAEEALDVFRSASPDLVVTDLLLGEDHSLGLIRKLRGEDAAVPIVVLSMYPPSGYRDAALGAGANDYVMKQESPGIFLETLASARSRR